MKIICTDPKQFFDTIAELVKRGLTFEADRDTLVIKLSGGY